MHGAVRLLGRHPRPAVVRLSACTVAELDELIAEAAGQPDREYRALVLDALLDARLAATANRAAAASLAWIDGRPP